MNQLETLKHDLNVQLERFSTTSAAVYRFNTAGEGILVAQQGFNPGQLEAFSTLAPDIQAAPSGSTPTPEDFQPVQLPAFPDSEALWYPLVHEGEISGMLLLVSGSPIKKPGTWNEDQVQALSDMAEAVSMLRDDGSGSTREDALDRFSTLEDLILILDPAGRILEANHPALSLLEYNLQQLESAPITRIYPEEREDLIQARLQAMNYQDSAEFQEPALSGTGNLLQLRTRLSWKTWKGQQSLAWISEILYESEPANESRSHSAEFFKGMYRNASVPVVMFDLEGSILQANNAFLELINCRYEKLIEKSIGSFIHPGDLAQHELRLEQILTGNLNHSQQYEERLLCGKTQTHVNCLLLLIKSEDGRPLYFIKHLQNISTRKEIELQLQHMATHDSLTNLPNRVMLNDRFLHARSIARREGRLLGLVCLDLDDFKLVNDTYGHAAGDQLLLSISDRLRSTVRESDTVSRIGGDEFVILLEGVRHSQDIIIVLEKMLEALSAPVDINTITTSITASAGFSIYPFDGDTLAELLHVADFAMYHVKGQGGYIGRPRYSSVEQLPLFKARDETEGENS